MRCNRQRSQIQMQKCVQLPDRRAARCGGQAKSKLSGKPGRRVPLTTCRRCGPDRRDRLIVKDPPHRNELEPVLKMKPFWRKSRMLEPDQKPRQNWWLQNQKHCGVSEWRLTCLSFGFSFPHLEFFFCVSHWCGGNQALVSDAEGLNWVGPHWVKPHHRAPSEQLVLICHQLVSLTQVPQSFEPLG